LSGTGGRQEAGAAGADAERDREGVASRAVAVRAAEAEAVGVVGNSDATGLLPRGVVGVAALVADLGPASALAASMPTSEPPDRGPAGASARRGAGRGSLAGDEGAVDRGVPGAAAVEAMRAFCAAATPFWYRVALYA
jgi:hypothetical protein